MSVEDRKHTLRMRMLRERAAREPEEAARLSRAAQEALAASPAWVAARSIALYMPIRGELSTDLLRELAAAQRKTLLLPRCDPKVKGRMDLVPCADPARLVSGAYGIPEPAPELEALDADDPGQGPDLLCAPAAAVDRRGFRLGYGGGYYDRLLARPALRRTLCIGLVYGFQIVPRLPVRAWDLPLRGFCTEHGLTLLPVQGD